MAQVSKKTSPRVSVCIPTYNYAAYIGATIESVLGQTYRDFELIIIDDCSSDTTSEIVAKYLTQDERVLFFKNSANLGMVENWNRCLEKTTGEYIKVLGADDLLEPSCLEKSVLVLDNNPRVSLVASARILIDKDGKPFKIRSYTDTFRIFSGRTVIRKCFFMGNLIGEPVAVLFRKKDSARGFNPQYRQLTDLEMWFFLLEKGDFAAIPEALCRFRVHRDQATKANMRSLTFIEDELLLFRNYIGKEYIGDTFLNRQQWKFKLCYSIWTHKFIGLETPIIRTEISRHLPLYLFYPLAYLKAIKDKVIEWSKMRKSS